MPRSEGRSIRFRFSAEKAREALAWMLSHAQRSLDLHTLLKACYFADKEHLNRFGRPVFGATYRAMKFGPVPLEIYEMLKCEPMWLAELSTHEFPWHINGHVIGLATNHFRLSNMTCLSETDLECLRNGLILSMSLDFNARTAATHGKDWQRANLGFMSYEDMYDNEEEKKEEVAVLRQTAHLMRL